MSKLALRLTGSPQKWAIDTAIDTATSVPSDRKAIAALDALVAQRPVQIAEKMLEITESTNRIIRGVVPEAVIPHLSGPKLAKAIELARDYTTLIHLASRVEEPLHSELLKRAYKNACSSSGPYHDGSLRDLVHSLAQVGSKAALDLGVSILTEIYDIAERAQALTYLVSVLPSEAVEPALKASAITLAGPTFRRPEVAGARAEAILAAASRLPPHRRNVLTRRILATVRALDGTARGVALARSARWLPADKRQPLVNEAFSLLVGRLEKEEQAKIGNMNRRELIAESLARVSSYISDDLVPEPYYVARRLHNDRFDEMLRTLAPRLPANLIFDVLPLIEDTETVEILATAAARSGSDTPPAVLSVLRQPRDRSSLLDHIGALSPLLSEATAKDVLESLSDVTAWIP